MAFIGKINAGSISNAPIAATLYGTCGTTAGTRVKAIACADYDLTTPITGMTIHIKFTNSNTYKGTIQLNINSTGAKNAYKNGTTNIGATEEESWRPNAVIPFTFDGSNWIMSGGSGEGIKYNAASSVTSISTNAVTGTSTAYAREDHIHNITKDTITAALGYTPPTQDNNTTYAAATSSTTIATSSVTGTSTAYARADHVHGITKAIITAALGYTPPSTDTNTTYAPASSVTSVGTASITGTSTAYARQDHVHRITKATVTAVLGFTPLNEDEILNIARDTNTDTITTVVSETTPSREDVVLWIDPS